MAYDEFINAAAKQNQLDPDLLRAMMQQESRGNPNAVSPKNAAGLMQLREGTAKDMGVADRFDPQQNIFGGAKYMRQMIDKYGDLDKAVQAYNYGPGNYDKYLKGEIKSLPSETVGYLDKVSANFANLKKGAMPQQANTDFADAFWGGSPQQQKADTSFADAFWGAPAMPAGKAAAMPVAAQAAPQQTPQGMPAFITDASGQQIPNPALPRKQPGSFTMGVGDTARGVVQMGSHALGSVLNAIAPNSQIARDFTAGVPQVDQQIRQQEQALQAQRAAAGETGFDWSRLAGGALGSAVVANPIAAALTQPVTEGDNFALEKGKQAAIGAALQGATKAVGRAISPNVRPDVELLMREGVTPTPGQVMGGALARTEEKARSVPGLGDVITSGQRRAVDDFNQAAYARALNPIGEKVTAPVGREAVEQVADKLGSAYNKLLPKLQFKADQQFAGEIGNIQQMATGLAESQAKQFDNIIRNDLIRHMTPQGNMSGESLKKVETALTQKAKNYLGSSVASERELGSALQATLDTVRSTLVRSNPTHAEQLSRINEGWANYARIRQASSMVGAENGIFTPNQLQSTVRALDKSVGKGNFAKGNALMQDLSEAGKNVLGQKYPDSGTAGRLALGAGLAGGLAAVNPAALAGAAVGALPYTAPGQRLAAALLTKRPGAAAPVGNFIDQYGSRLGAMLAPGALMATGQR
jgi:hypothetical protein